MNIILVRPIITEASMKDAQNGRFTFEIHKDASKTDVRREVEKTFGVNVKAVRTVTIKRRGVVMTKFGRKDTSITLKKARVELVKGQTIPAFEINDKKEDKKKEKKAK